MDKNKIIFISLIGLVVTFIICYTVFAMGDENEIESVLIQPGVPDIKDEQKQYNSKLDAVNDFKEVKESNAPSIYDESYLDSDGSFGAMNKEKHRQSIVDSIYRNSRIEYASDGTADSGPNISITDDGNSETGNKPSLPDFSKSHQAFFNVVEKPESKSIDAMVASTDDFIMVEVNGEQTVRNDERLELRLAVDALINGDTIVRNSLVYGFVSFKANRVSIRITNIDNKAVDLKAFDLLDGNEGIYIKNSVQAEATGEVLDDIIQDINIPGVPQIGGIKQIFRRKNRNIKATVYNQYQLILKPSL